MSAYEERVRRGMARGYTRSQASGRPRKGELSVQELETGRLTREKMQEFRRISQRMRKAGRRWRDDPWLDIPDSFLEELSHNERDAIFGY